jgi:hypothetical protein
VRLEINFPHNASWVSRRITEDAFSSIGSLFGVL